MAFTLGTRGSALALAQAALARAALEPVIDDAVVLREIKTTGDKRQDLSLTHVTASGHGYVSDRPGEKPIDPGLFTKELESALLAGEIDVAVHSLKDLPTALPAGLVLAAVLPRADTADVLIYQEEERRKKEDVSEVFAFPALPAGGLVATSSLRRQRQLLHLRPDLRVCAVRGNVGTRLAKLRDNADWSALVLARAGLERLGYGEALAVGALKTEGATFRIEVLGTDVMLPAVGQGAIGMQCRADDRRTLDALAAVNHEPTWAAVTAERALLSLLGGGCQMPLGVATSLNDTRAELCLRAILFHAPDAPPPGGECPAPAGRGRGMRAGALFYFPRPPRRPAARRPAAPRRVRRKSPRWRRKDFRANFNDFFSAAISRFMASAPAKKTGVCYLVGAGPGDLGLVTLRARECVEKADVILYDALCNPAILAWAPATAEIIFAGKRAGAHALKQAETNALLVEHARGGKTVVRLKGGDPFVFGRGGEEALELARAGVKFEIVPGVSSAIAGPAYAGIPVTQRGQVSQLTIFTGHEDPEKGETRGAAVDFAQLAQTPGTKVMLMGLERLESVARQLLAGGAEPALPVALVRWATTARQETLVGTLENIAERAEAAGFETPAIAVFGEVVKLREELNWFETDRPLAGKRIVVTRTRKQAGALSTRLAALGADVFEIPTIRTEPPADLRAFAELVRDAHTYDWVLFTSPNGVSAFFEWFYKLYDDARDIGGARIAAVGPATAARVREFHLKVDLQPGEAVAEALVAALEKEHGSVENLKLLLVRPETTREIIASALEKKGAIVDEAIGYRTVPETEAGDRTGAIERFRREGADMLTFASSSAVENFLALGLPLPPDVKFASLGPITSGALRARGLRVDVESPQASLDAFAEAIRRFYAGKKTVRQKEKLT